MFWFGSHPTSPRSVATTLVLLVSASLLITAGCATAKPAAPPTPPYQPSYRYSLPPSPKDRVDVTVGLVAPQFTGAGEAYWEQSKRDHDTFVIRMRQSLTSSLEELLSSKGFTVAGPYDDIDSMTFPEKKGADLVLYPLMNIDSGYTVGNVRVERDVDLLGNVSATTICDVSFAPSGAVQFVAAEPLSGEKMWIKKVDITQPIRSFRGTGKVCQKQGVTQDIRNAWGQAHEALFQTIMKNIDRYVNTEEFVMLKQQARELRDKKAY